MEKIPKIVHYCWFGKGQYTELIDTCIKSWHKHLSDYEFIRWDEENFDIDSNQFVKEAYANKKWAFVSDYVRLYALKMHGGVYLDTDLELLDNLDPFLIHDAFSGFEKVDAIPTAVMGATKDHPWINKLLSYYDNRPFVKDDSTLDTTTNVEIITKLTLDNYSLVLNNKFQELEEGIVIFPNDVFCPKDYDTGKINLTNRTVSIHHFESSWLSEFDQKVKKKRIVLTKIFGQKIGDLFVETYISIKQTGIKKTIRRIVKYFSKQ